VVEMRLVLVAEVVVDGGVTHCGAVEVVEEYVGGSYDGEYRVFPNVVFRERCIGVVDGMVASLRRTISKAVWSGRIIDVGYSGGVSIGEYVVDVGSAVLSRCYCIEGSVCCEYCRRGGV